jgi:hypothetical protein
MRNPLYDLGVLNNYKDKGSACQILIWDMGLRKLRVQADEGVIALAPEEPLCLAGFISKY